ncbi:phosphatidylinositol 4-phosphate 5-kinase type-1 alpha-like [Clupea harengus]|uniref:Phosphatidylinositol 4-phosphate 5-kinase type-1 alpha-like n=1 Tax=Clupea harengus TaxID=7950 RepID=A0A8M1K5P3_CLUHA|nr:phosphatidylinositol 4-phosphate 5-kinase type-1 alpha-like [Clupea harengus]
MDHQTFNIPESSLSELLNYFDEIQCSTQTVQDELASDLASEKALDKFDEISLVVAALQIENTKLWSKLDKLYGEVDTLRSENNKLRDEVKSQWEALNNAFELSSPAVPIKKIIGHRGIDVTGETTYKETTASDLEGAIQLGISYTVQEASRMDQREVLIQDFEVMESVYFPRKGSKWTPPHHYKDFHFKIYAPFGFFYFREKFGIPPDDYEVSLCSKALLEQSNSGASGSLFCLSSDDKFIIKTVQRKEAEFLQRMLPGYYNTLLRNRHTLLPKFYGLYCVHIGSKYIRIVVMNNLLPTTVPIHLKYDLKGSTYRRQASREECTKPLPTYKDLDFLRDLPDGILLEAGHYDVLRNTIHEDCLLLQSFRIMDYSLLVAIHKIQQGTEESPPLVSDYSNGVIPATTCKGEKMWVFAGIIDILQSYRLLKKLEHSWKAIFQDADTVSVHRPGFYADRFEKFLWEKVFTRRIPLKSSLSKSSRVGYHHDPWRVPSMRSNINSRPSYINHTSRSSILKNSPSYQASKTITAPGHSSASLNFID